MFQLSPLVVFKRSYRSTKMADEFCLKMPDFHVTFRDLLRAVNQRHGTDGFTSPPKEGVLRIFSPWKIQRLRWGLNPRTWVPKASTLPLDHRSRYLAVGCVSWNTDSQRMSTFILAGNMHPDPVFFFFSQGLYCLKIERSETRRNIATYFSS